MAVPPEQPPVYPPPGAPVEQPTAPIDPVAPRQVPPRAYREDPRVYREDPYVDPRREAWRWEGLRTALTIVGLLALIAIGLAVWALLKANHNQRVVTRGGSNAALVGLTSRVDRLQAKVNSLPTGGSGGGSSAGTQALSQRVAALEAAQKQLSATQKQLSSKVGSGGNSAAVSQLTSKYSALSAKVSQWVGKEAALSGQVSGLQGRVAQLAGQVRQLQSQSGSNTTVTTTTGTTTGP